MLTPQPSGKWWHIVGGTDVTPIRDDVSADLDAYAIPWIRARVAV